MKNIKLKTAALIISAWIMFLAVPVAHAVTGSIIAEDSGVSEVEISAKNYGGTAVSHFYTANGTSGSPTQAVNGQLIGGIGSRPYTGSDFTDHSTAAIHWIAGEDIDSGHQGTWMKFLTTPIGSPNSARQVAMQLSPSGFIYYKAGTAQAYKTGGTQTLTNATYSAVSFGSEQWDNRSMYNNTYPTRLTAQAAGKYRVEATIAFNGNATGARLINFRKNGNSNDRYGYQATPTVGAGLLTVVSSSTTLDLAAGDYVEVYAYQNSGGNLTLADETTQPGIARFTMHYTGE